MEAYSRNGSAYDALHDVRGVDYKAGASTVTRVILDRNPTATTLLDVACGTGRHLEHFRPRFQVEGVDLAEGMASVAEARLRDVPVHRGDMRTFALDRKFDAVTCLYSGIGYLLTEDELRAALNRMVAHLSANGVLVVEPWIHPNTWFGASLQAEAGTSGEIAVARVTRSFNDGTLTVLEMHWTVGVGTTIEQFVERHELRLYTIEQYTAAFEAAGLTVEHDPIGITGRGLFVGTPR